MLAAQPRDVLAAPFEASRSQYASFGTVALFPFWLWPLLSFYPGGSVHLLGLSLSVRRFGLGAPWSEVGGLFSDVDVLVWITIRFVLCVVCCDKTNYSPAYLVWISPWAFRGQYCTILDI